jgi:hypothetical protein
MSRILLRSEYWNREYPRNMGEPDGLPDHLVASVDCRYQTLLKVNQDDDSTINVH